MKIGIIGCGWLGIKIAEYLRAGNDIFVTTTSKTKEPDLTERGFNPLVIRFPENENGTGHKPWEISNELDVAIITVPFSKSEKIADLDNKFSNISLFLGNFEKQLFLMSSIGIYPQCELELHETTLNPESLNPSIYFGEELMKQKYPHINILRLGGLMGDNRVFSKYKTSEPYQIVNHVHYEDICAIIGTMIAQKSSGKTYNVVAPMHPTKNEITCFQTGSDSNVATEKPYGRKIISEKMQSELRYDFIRPNPTEFHWK